jgi:hypothetical protein
MGIGNHELYFLKYISKNISFKSVATIGRLLLVSDSKDIKEIFCTNKEYEGYCENFFKEELNSLEIESYDFDSYEKADHIFDFNLELKNPKVYDLVIDFGSMEHIFNVAQVIKNICNLCNEGGYILHANPCSNLSGHGFYQFSPEFYYSVYSEENGFEDTEVFLAEYTEDNRHVNYWYKSTKPKDGKRIEFYSDCAVGALVITKKKQKKSNIKVIQSDYVHAYKNIYKSSENKKKNIIKEFLKKINFVKKNLAYYGKLKYRFNKNRLFKEKYLKNNKNFEKIFLNKI